MEIRHGREMVDMRRVLDPVNHVLRRVFHHPGNVGAACDLIQGRSDECFRFANSGNGVTGGTSILDDGCLASFRIASGHRSRLLLELLTATGESDQGDTYERDSNALRAMHNHSIGSWSRDCR